MAQQVDRLVDIGRTGVTDHVALEQLDRLGVIALVDHALRHDQALLLGVNGRQRRGATTGEHEGAQKRRQSGAPGLTSRALRVGSAKNRAMSPPTITTTTAGSSALPALRVGTSLLSSA